jgi:hypothetical protein
VPSVTFLGPFYERRRADTIGPWLRGKVVEVTQEWLNYWRHTLPLSHFEISDEEEVVSSNSREGIPDPTWSRRDILQWLADNNVDIGSGYVTKTGALALVAGHLNPITELGDEQ